MKINKTLLSIVILPLSFGTILAQTESGSLIKPFGIGLHIEQFKINELNDLNSAPVNKIVFTISPMKSLRLEPEVGVKIGKDKTNNLKNSSFNLGLGAFGMLQRNQLNLYSGIRFEYAIVKSDDYSNLGNGSIIVNTKTNRFSISPVIGCEYYLGTNFTFGGDLGLKYATLKSVKSQKPAGAKDEASNYITTDTGLFIRFYFGK